MQEFSWNILWNLDFGALSHQEESTRRQIQRTYPLITVYSQDTHFPPTSVQRLGFYWTITKIEW